MTPRRHDARFFELIDLAKEGDEVSIDELMRTYRHDFRADGDPRDQLPTRKTQASNTTNEEY
jgi:hypothetical protein